MTMGKIAISLPVEQIEAAKRAVSDGRATSVSAYISASLRQTEERHSLAELLRQWADEDGPVTEDDAAEIDAFFDGLDARNRRS
ncbi:MAG: type II toxin-antitoxin system ParD family antitoxin [Mycobacteriales bacterium]